MDEGSQVEGAQGGPQEETIAAENVEEALTLHEPTHVEVYTDFGEFDDVQSGTGEGGEAAWMAHFAEMQLAGRPIAHLTEQSLILFGEEGEIGRLSFGREEPFRFEGDLSASVVQYDGLLQMLACYGELLGAYAEALLSGSGPET